MKSWRDGERNDVTLCANTPSLHHSISGWTLVRILQALVGAVNTCQLRTECLQERFETYRYRGKTLLIGPDVRGDFLMERGASMLKVLVDGGPAEVG